MKEAKLLRKTKIVCTIGPATDNPDMIRRLIRAGMDVVRLNFSHGTHESHGKSIAEVRAAAAELGREVGILMDLAGPKIRLGEIGETRLEPGAEIVLASGQTAEKGVIPVNYQYLYEDIEVGNRILLADGQVELLVVEKKEQHIHCQVVVGGIITSHKGVNLPSSDLRIPAFTDKDRQDLEFGLTEGVDFVAMSFVRHEHDLVPIREMISKLEHPPLLIAKIEKPQALERLPEILRKVEGLMVARGDLGVEMPLEEVPIIQKRLIQEARRAGRVVITATQMLRSMMTSPRPTRAEVTDVANAALDGTDAVMLSDETAVGQYPVEAVKVLDKVCQYTEPQLNEIRFLKEDLSDILPLIEASISRAATWLARDLEPAAIVASTASGSTARLMARYRPPYPVVGLTADRRTCRQLTISWGVVPALILACSTVDEMLKMIKKWVSDNGVAGPTDHLILTAGIPLSVKGTTNMIKVVDMAAPDEKGNY